METKTLLNLAWPDFLVIAVYLVGIVGLGLWAWANGKSGSPQARNISWRAALCAGR